MLVDTINNFFRFILILSVVIRKETKLIVSDNSDAKIVQCIHPNRKKSTFKRTSLASFVKVTIKKKVSRRKNLKKRVN
jgi:ribosomal protein L14